MMLVGMRRSLLLPDVGFTGNTHMLMEEKNNLQIADWLIEWIGEKVEMGKGRATVPGKS